MDLHAIRALLLCFVVVASSYGEPSLHISEAVRIYAASEVRGQTFMSDAVMPVLRESAEKLHVFRTSPHRIGLFSGPLHNPESTLHYFEPIQKVFTVLPGSRASYLGIRLALDHAKAPCYSLRSDAIYGNVYLKNLYDMGGGALLGFLHMEYLLGCRANAPWYPANYTIALCRSRDIGRTWTFMGDIIGVHNLDFYGACSSADTNAIAGNACNIGGAPYLVVGEHFYVYYNEAGPVPRHPSAVLSERRHCVARAPVSEVLAAARLDTPRVTSWEKWDGKGWNGEDGLTGLGAEVLPAPPPRTGFDMSNDAAFCAPLGEYLLTAHQYVHPVDPPHKDRLVLFRSKDGLRWRLGPTLFEAETLDRHPTYSCFASLSDDASADCSIVGTQFTVYFRNMRFEPEHADDLPLWRVDVSVVERESPAKAVTPQ
ncbi:MAG: hypothetical protein GF331_02460 [Chitinivibrionales bacterium]|nr:hypothetical protein [Chitinivibrionales bacterium]